MMSASGRQQWRCQHKQIKDNRRRKDKLLQDNSSGLVASRCERGEENQEPDESIDCR